MGKVLAQGHAEQEYAPNYCNIVLFVETEGTTAAKAEQSVMAEMEKLLSVLSDIGIKPECMTISDDRSEKPYRRNEDSYSSRRTLNIPLPINLALVNRIHGIIAAGFENVTFRVDYDVKPRAALMRELTQQAIKDSRRNADLIAEATGTKVVGIKAANLSGDDCDMNIADLDLSILDDDASRYHVHECCRGIDTPFSDRLTPEKITLEADVKIVWLVE